MQPCLPRDIKQGNVSQNLFEIIWRMWTHIKVCSYLRPCWRLRVIHRQVQSRHGNASRITVLLWSKSANTASIDPWDWIWEIWIQFVKINDSYCVIRYKHNNGVMPQNVLDLSVHLIYNTPTIQGCLTGVIIKSNNEVYEDILEEPNYYNSHQICMLVIHSSAKVCLFPCKCDG